MVQMDFKIGFEAPSAWPIFGREFENAAWEILSVAVRRAQVGGDDLELLRVIAEYLRPRLADVCSMGNVYLVGSAGLNPYGGSAAAHAARRAGVRDHLARSGIIVPRGPQVDREYLRPDGSLRLLTSIAFDPSDLAAALRLTQEHSMVCVAANHVINEDELFMGFSAAIESDVGVDSIDWRIMVEKFVAPRVALLRASAEFDDPEIAVDWFIDKSDSRSLRAQLERTS